MTREQLPNGDGKLRVLIVDDNAEWAGQVRRLIERRLPESGREVRWESTMEGALGSQAEFHPNITLLDLDLPDSPPDKTIEIIKSFVPPVFVISAFQANNEIEFDKISLRCIRAGAVRVYSKDAMVILFLVREMVQEYLVSCYGPAREHHPDLALTPT